jgi:hypothetical protein
MTLGIRAPAVIDTGVFAARLTPSGSLLAARYRPLLAGRPAKVTWAATDAWSAPGSRNHCTSQAESASSILVILSRFVNGVSPPAPPFGRRGCGAGHHSAAALGFAAPCWWGRRR